jgi:tRNA pseudouridine38-40 synthase
MRNLRLIIEYDGTNFYGWQYQPDKRTVQGEIESAIKKITGEETRIIGAGRTDQGVHAFGQIANFKTDTDISCNKLKDALNALTGDDIYIKDVREVSFDFHARFSAKSKVYQYKIMSQFSPLKRKYYWFIDYNLNLRAMDETIKSFIGEHNFKNLSVSNENDFDEQEKNTLCNIFNLTLTEMDNDVIITIEANRFLRKMVRGIVGFLVDVGRGRFIPGDTDNLFNRTLNGIYFAPAHGLYLIEVKY